MSESLRQILNKLSMMDEDMTPEDFNPQEIVGDLKDKVDSVKWRIDTWRAQAQMIEDEWIAQLTAKRKALLAKAKKLSDYVKEQMILHKFESLPGSLVRIDLKASPVAVKYQKEAGPEDFIKFGDDLVKQKIDYDWNTSNIRDLLKAGAKLPFAELTQDTHIRFHLKKGDK